MGKLLGKYGEKAPDTARTIATLQWQVQIYRSRFWALAADELKAKLAK
jgi:hypothetical protein